MSVESATYVSDLDTDNPADEDTASEGAAHLRLLKEILKESGSSTDPDADTLAVRDSKGRLRSEPGGSGKEVATYDDARTSYLGLPIGVPFPVFDHLNGIDPPSNDGDAKFIRLTAGEDGDGEYNEGLLANESVSGSAPEVEATADIDYSESPINGEPVHLINTEESFLRARETSGELQFDQMQKITGTVGRLWERYLSSPHQEGAFRKEDADKGRPDQGNNEEEIDIYFDSADSPDARASSSTDGETRAKNVSATYYMRIA